MLNNAQLLFNLNLISLTIFPGGSELGCILYIKDIFEGGERVSPVVRKLSYTITSLLPSKKFFCCNFEMVLHF